MAGVFCGGTGTGAMVVEDCGTGSTTLCSGAMMSSASRVSELCCVVVAPVSELSATL